MEQRKSSENIPKERSRTTVRFNLTRPSTSTVRSAASAGSFLSRQPSDDVSDLSGAESDRVLVEDESLVDPNPFKDKDWNKARADPDNFEEISFFIHYWKIFLRVLFAFILATLTFR